MNDDNDYFEKITRLESHFVDETQSIDTAASIAFIQKNKDCIKSSVQLKNRYVKHDYVMSLILDEFPKADYAIISKHLRKIGLPTKRLDYIKIISLITTIDIILMYLIIDSELAFNISLIACAVVAGLSAAIASIITSEIKYS